MCLDVAWAMLFDLAQANIFGNPKMGFHGSDEVMATG